MGTGPFRLAEGGLEHFALERNPDWWGRERWPFDVDRVEFATNYDIGAEVADLLVGRVDFLPFPPRVAARPLGASARHPHRQDPDAAGSQVLVMNHGAAELASSDVRGRNPFRDRRVRRAVYQAIDIARLRRESDHADDVPIGMPVPPGINGYDPELDRRLPPTRRGPGVARRGRLPGRLQGAAGRLGRQRPRRLYASLVTMLGEVGIRVALARPTDAEKDTRIGTARADLYDWGCGTSLYNSATTSRSFYRSGNRSPNASGYANPELDALLDTIGAELSSPIRDALIEHAWRIGLDDIVHVPLFRRVQTWAMRDRLELPPDPRTAWDFRYARLKEAAAR